MKAFVKSNTYNPGLVEMDGMVGQVCELTGHTVDDAYVVQQPNSHRTWWFCVNDLVMEDSPDFTDWVSSKILMPTHHGFVTISRSDLQALKSFLKEEIRVQQDFIFAIKRDAKYYASVGDKGQSKKLYRLYDKYNKKLRGYEGRMKAIKKALT